MSIYSLKLKNLIILFSYLEEKLPHETDTFQQKALLNYGIFFLDRDRPISAVNFLLYITNTVYLRVYCPNTFLYVYNT